MSEYTKNLNLFKYDVVEDGKQPFSIEQALNENWDIIDNLMVKKSGDTMSGGLEVCTSTGSLYVGSTSSRLGSIELFGGGTAYGGYIDFHNGSTKTDYTSRIAETAPGVLTYDCTSVRGAAISGVCMPSGTFADLTLGASAARYTAPASGWVVLVKTAGQVGHAIDLRNHSNGLRSVSIAQGSTNGLAAYLPVAQNQQFSVTYSATGTTAMFRFVYAQGVS